MAKIGIMSMQRIANYGSFLQAYGLKSMIENMGHEVEFVDYHVGTPVIAENMESSNKLIRKINKTIETFKGEGTLTQKITYIHHKRSFNRKYNKLLGLTKKPNYNPNLDALVIGSDEVFNCIQKNTNVGYSPELFGKDNNAKKVITYAGSFGNTTYNKIRKYNKVKELSDYLLKIDAISVRDQNSYDVVQKLTGKRSNINLDPVLIYDFMHEKSLVPYIKPKEKYMIVYAYSGRISNEESAWIKEYAKEKDLKIYAIGGAQSCADKLIDCSPFEVLAYFQNAEEVITDTFHGSIFSIITKRKFTTLVRKSVGNSYGNEEKLTDLLKRLGLDSRITYDVKNTKTINETYIDYEPIEEIIRRERLNASHYLEKELGLCKRTSQ